jgi:hypothetical protein
MKIGEIFKALNPDSLSPIYTADKYPPPSHNGNGEEKPRC